MQQCGVHYRSAFVLVSCCGNTARYCDKSGIWSLLLVDAQFLIGGSMWIILFHGLLQPPNSSLYIFVCRSLSGSLPVFSSIITTIAQIRQHFRNQDTSISVVIRLCLVFPRNRDTISTLSGPVRGLPRLLFTGYQGHILGGKRPVHEGNL